MIKVFLIILIFVLNVHSFDKLYFLPKDNKSVKKDVIKLIKNAKYSINIAMYNIRYSKFIKELNKASKRGVEVNVFYEKKDGKYDKDIKFYKTKKKLHTKLAIFDEKVIFFGSANWKKNSFSKNYEVVNITDEKNKVKKFNKFFKQLKENN